MKLYVFYIPPHCCDTHTHARAHVIIVYLYVHSNAFVRMTISRKQFPFPSVVVPYTTSLYMQLRVKYYGHKLSVV